MILKFKPEYFSFPTGDCFTIRRGIVQKGNGEAILECRDEFIFRGITDVAHIRLCDLLEDPSYIHYWHLYDLGDPYETIKECYPGIHDKEIVTVVWMVSVE